MTLNLLSLKPAQLRLIQAIADHGQLQLAAAAVSMTQPAASRMLAEIERAVGAALFLRQPKGMEPTDIGAVVVRRAQAMLRELRSMSAEVRALREGYGGAVRVGAVTGPAVGYLVPAIREIKRQSPAAEITVDVLPRAICCANSQRGISISRSRGCCPILTAANSTSTPCGMKR
ncbi:LysR family transcriptional regulator [Gemmobacter lanyuensis]